jgi:squalene-hopene/tetraprenyl-beta-curcumene cyclase
MGICKPGFPPNQAKLVLVKHTAPRHIQPLQGVPMSIRLGAAALVLASALAGPFAAAADDSGFKKDVEASIDRTQRWLLAQQQPNGAFIAGDQFALGVTELITNALARDPKKIAGDDERMKKALAFIVKFQQPDGGFYDPAEGLGDYGTSLALMVFKSTGTGDPAVIKKAQEYLFGIQNIDAKDPAHGGIGYGDDKRGDENVVTTQFAVEALRSTGVPANDPHLVEALKFLERCQNLSSHNKMPWAGMDGSSVYSPKESKAGGSFASEEDKKAGDEQAASGKLNGYGSMTYALISSYIALDLKPTDERVAAALGWVRDHYQFDANPGMRPGAERQGLFYYYLMMAKTLDTLGIRQLEMKDGSKVDWRRDLYKAIIDQANAAKVGDDAKGGLMWMNSERRWAENQPTVATGYMLSALKHISHSLE